MNTERTRLADAATAIVSRAGGIAEPVRLRGIYTIECYRDGRLRWVEKVYNTIVNVGMNDILDKYLAATAYTAQHYIGLTDADPNVVNTDTMASHPGWAEVHTEYSQGARPDLTALWAPAGGRAKATAGPAAFSITAPATVGGIFVTDAPGKGGATGLLVSGSAFAGGNKGVDNGDTLNVNLTYSG